VQNNVRHTQRKIEEVLEQEDGDLIQLDVMFVRLDGVEEEENITKYSIITETQIETVVQKDITV